MHGFWCFALGVYCFYKIFKLFWCSIQIESQLEKANELLSNCSNKKNFVKEFREISSQILMLDAISYSWSVFSSQFNYDSEKNVLQTIKEYTPPDKIFTLNNICKPLIEWSQWKELKSRILYLGILGGLCQIIFAIFWTQKYWFSPIFQSSSIGHQQIIKFVFLALLILVSTIILMLYFQFSSKHKR